MTVSLAALLVALFTTANVDPQGRSDIPTPEQKSANTSSADAGRASADLPLPYSPWRGTGLMPPSTSPARELPPPLARPRPAARRPFELSAALSAFLPSCGSGSIDDRNCLTLSAGSGLDLALLYRPSPFFAFGLEGALSGFGNGHGMLSSSGGRAQFLGVVGRVYFADTSAWDPYVSLTLGVGSLDLRSPDDDKVATTGLGARVAGGLDYRFGSHLRLGPCGSFSRWVASADASCRHGVCRDENALYGHVLGFATLGLRLSGSFGDAL